MVLPEIINKYSHLTYVVIIFLSYPTGRTSSCFFVLCLRKTLGLHQSSQTLHSGAPFSAWKGVMFSVLLLCRSAVLATPKDDSSACSYALTGNAVVEAESGRRGLQKPVRAMPIDDHYAGREEQHRELHVHDTLESAPSLSEEAEWTKHQSNADGAAVEINESSFSTAGGGTKDRGRRESGTELTAIQAESAQAIAEQLQNEASRWRRM